jgi:hypothetical protein
MFLGSRARPVHRTDLVSSLGNVVSLTSLNPIGLHVLLRGWLLRDKLVHNYWCYPWTIALVFTQWLGLKQNVSACNKATMLPEATVSKAAYQFMVHWLSNSQSCFCEPLKYCSRNDLLVNKTWLRNESGRCHHEHEQAYRWQGRHCLCKSFAVRQMLLASGRDAARCWKKSPMEVF